MTAALPDLFCQEKNPVLHLILHEHHHHKSKANQLISVTQLRTETWKLSMQVASQQNQQIMQVKNLPCTHFILMFLSQKKSIKKHSTWKPKFLKRGKRRQVKSSPLVGQKQFSRHVLRPSLIIPSPVILPLNHCQRKAIHVKQIWSQPRVTYLSQSKNRSEDSPWKKRLFNLPLKY